MKDKLTEEEVLHVAHLARIAVSKDEVGYYAKCLKDLMNDIDKIKDVDCHTEDILVTPVSHTSVLRKDVDTRVVDFKEMQENLPKTVGKFVEVWVDENE